MEPPFTVEQFLGVFRAYNLAVWPMQIVFYAVAAAVVALAVRPRPGSGPWISGLLALLWAWMGVVYHWDFFRSINPAAALFAAMFVLQAALFLGAGVVRPRLAFRARPGAAGVAGAALVAYALLVYPILGALAGHPYPDGPTFGLPCPTTIFTLGLLLWAERPVPLSVVAIPALWSLIGAAAAVSLGMVEDYALPVAGVVGTGMIAWKNRRRRRSARYPAAA